jgi:hypothetical protein
VFVGSELTKGTVAFQYKAPLLAQSYRDHLTMKEACELKGNTQIEMWEKGERQGNVCNRVQLVREHMEKSRNWPVEK